MDLVYSGSYGRVSDLRIRIVMVQRTSTNDYCASCHSIHPQATTSWKQSVHYIHRIRNAHQLCGLSPAASRTRVIWQQKVKTGARDVWSKWTKDSASFNWEERDKLEHARKHVYESSCIACHENLFPPELTKEGADAHLYYTSKNKPADLQCINCHLNAGHYIDGYVHGGNTGFGATYAG